MENRDRDKMSKKTSSTSAGYIDRNTSSRQGQKNDSSVDFGESIGRSENLGSESSRRSGSVGSGGMSGLAPARSSSSGKSSSSSSSGVSGSKSGSGRGSDSGSRQ